MANIIKMPEKKGVKFTNLKPKQAFISLNALYIKTASSSRANSALNLENGQHYSFGEYDFVQPVDLEILVKE